MNDESVSSFCENCGAELDDFASCGCSFDGTNPKPAKRKQPFASSMRTMVARKLAKQREVKP